MPWSRFDDAYDEHDKIEDAWFAFPPNPVGLHVMATTACNRWLSDGVIRPRWINQKLPEKRARERILAYMVEHELFDLLPAGEELQVRDSAKNAITLGPFPEDRYVVHDFLDRHDSSVQVKSKRRADAQRKADARAAAAQSPAGVREESERTPTGHRAESEQSPRASRARGRGGAQASPDPTRPDHLSLKSPDTTSARDRASVAGHGAVSLDDLAEEIRGILQRGIDGLTTDERCKPPTKRAILDALVEHQPSPVDAKAVAIEVRSIAQSQDRAPNIAGLFAQKLGEHPTSTRAAA